jgi:hypothetical protein
MMPSSHTAKPGTLWPPPQTDTRRLLARAKIDSVHHIGNPSAAGDQRWVPVNHSIMDLANQIIALPAGADKLTPQALLKFFDGCFLKNRVSAGGGCSLQVYHQFPSWMP